MDNTPARFEEFPKDEPRPSLPERLLKAELDKETPNLDVLDRLLGMQDRWEEKQQRLAYRAAFAAAKAEMPLILKNKKVGYSSERTGKQTGYKHADLGEVVDTVVPILGKHGLWHQWRVTTEPKIVVVCILGHSNGYVEEGDPWSSAPDHSGSKNDLQAVMSAVTYLERYSLMARLGLAAGEDDDGAGIDATPITADQAIDLQNKMQAAGISLARLQKIYGIEKLEQLPQRQLGAVLELVGMTLSKRLEKKKADATAD